MASELRESWKGILMKVRIEVKNNIRGDVI